MLVKICGVQDPEIASFAAKEGANLIGVVLTHGFKRSVSLEQGKKIVDAARKNGAIPVGVFVSEPASKIGSICDFLGIEFVQAYDLVGPLPEHLKRIHINNSKALLRPDRDLVLMEADTPGQGEKLDFDTFNPPEVKPWMIAGGLTPENVKRLILRFRPSGVCVSSGVEKEGRKDPERILKFIQEVRSCE